MTEASTAQSQPARDRMWGSAVHGHVLPFLILLVIGLALPLFAGCKYARRVGTER